MADDYLSKGIAALRAGNKREARRLLLAATLAAPDDERAWGWLYEVAESDEERLRYVKEFLRLNPNDAEAQKQYAELTRVRFLRSARSPQNAPAAASVAGRSRGGAAGWRPSRRLIILASAGGILLLGAAALGLSSLLRGTPTPATQVSGFPSLGPATALADTSAISTPSPAPLPTTTPVPTAASIFTTSPLGLAQGSPFVSQNSDGAKWEIRVVKSESARSLQASFSSGMESTTGRFAIVYLEVTNRAQSTDSFQAGSFLSIQDASNRRYEESPAATFIVQVRDNIDLCVDINPGATRTCVGVYDISKDSDFYRFVPSSGADQNTPPVLLEIP